MTPKPILRWPGGKTRLLKHLLPLIRPHRCYVEAFGGGLALFLGKERSKVEVVNDLNGDLVSLYRCAQWHLDALVGEIEWTLTSRANVADFRTQLGLTELQRAARFFLLNRMSFGGGGTHYAVSKVSAQASRQNVLDGLRALNQRLDKVSVECLPYERLLSLYDSPETLWFFDPPYTAGETGNYQAWNDEQMSAFAARVVALRGDWIVTVNDTPLHRELFTGHDLRPVVTRSGTGNQRLRGSPTFAEIIIRRRRRAAAAVQAVTGQLRHAA